MIKKKTDYKFIYTFRVRYAEVDAQGIVFNAHYLTYFDCLITEYYRKLKYNYALEVKKNQKDFHVIKTTLEYKKPLLFDFAFKKGKITIFRVSKSRNKLKFFILKGKVLDEKNSFSGTSGVVSFGKSTTRIIEEHIS